MNSKLIISCRKDCRVEYAPKIKDVIRDETLGLTKFNPGYSCLDILRNGPTEKKSGLYYIENIDNKNKPYKVYCE